MRYASIVNPYPLWGPKPEKSLSFCIWLVFAVAFDVMESKEHGGQILPSRRANTFIAPQHGINQYARETIWPIFPPRHHRLEELSMQHRTLLILTLLFLRLSLCAQTICQKYLDNLWEIQCFWFISQVTLGRQWLWAQKAVTWSRVVDGNQAGHWEWEIGCALHVLYLS